MFTTLRKHLLTKTFRLSIFRCLIVQDSDAQNIAFTLELNSFTEVLKKRYSNHYYASGAVLTVLEFTTNWQNHVTVWRDTAKC